MRKQELLHLHGLLAETAEYLETSQDQVVARGEYESPGTKPTAIHAAKRAHKQAVFSLLDALTAAVDATNREPIPTHSD